MRAVGTVYISSKAWMPVTLPVQDDSQWQITQANMSWNSGFYTIVYCAAKERGTHHGYIDRKNSNIVFMPCELCISLIKWFDFFCGNTLHVEYLTYQICGNLLQPWMILKNLLSFFSIFFILNFLCTNKISYKIHVHYLIASKFSEESCVAVANRQILAFIWFKYNDQSLFY